MTSDSTSAANSAFTESEFAQALDDYDFDLQPGKIVRGRILEHTSQGALVDIAGKAPGFVPLKEAALEKVDDLAQVMPLEQELDLAIIGAPNAEGQLPLSRRQILRQEAWDEIAELQADGRPVSVTVTGTNRGGVTGNVRGLRAFVPRSHLLERGDLDELVGQTLTASFLEVDAEQNKLVLSQREAARASALQQLASGSLAEGTITNIKPYGVFVDLGGVTGLLHIKHVSQNRVESLPELFEIGQTVQVIVLEVDEWQGRVSLATKALEEYPGELIESPQQVMANAQARFEAARAQGKIDQS